MFPMVPLKYWISHYVVDVVFVQFSLNTFSFIARIILVPFLGNVNRLIPFMGLRFILLNEYCWVTVCLYVNVLNHTKSNTHGFYKYLL